jgi:hypothetical protein
MICNDEELRVVRQQLSLIEEALESLRRDVLPRNKRNFEVLSEGYYEQIDILRRDIDDYLAGGSTAINQASSEKGTPHVPLPASDVAGR